jgi:hypothetical protein
MKQDAQIQNPRCKFSFELCGQAGWLTYQSIDTANNRQFLLSAKYLPQTFLNSNILFVFRALFPLVSNFNIKHTCLLLFPIKNEFLLRYN